MEEALLDILIIMSVILILAGKAKKGKNQKKNNPVPPIAAEGPARNIFERDFSTEFPKESEPHDLQDFPQKNPQNQDYFTYETLETETFEDELLQKNKVEKHVEKKQQNIENEEVKNIDLQFNTQELTKGIIFAEILKRPNY